LRAAHPPPVWREANRRALRRDPRADPGRRSVRRKLRQDARRRRFHGRRRRGDREGVHGSRGTSESPATWPVGRSSSARSDPWEGRTTTSAARRPTMASMRSSIDPTPARSAKAGRRSVSGPNAPTPSSKTTSGSSAGTESRIAAM